MIRDVFEIYNRNLLQIMAWSFLIIMPVTILSYFSILYVNDLDGVNRPESYAGWFLVMNFVLCIPPFLMMTIFDYRDEKVSIKKGILFFLKQFGLILLFTSVLYLIALWGMVLLFIPTFIAFLFIIVFPFFSEMTDIRTLLRRTASKIAEENISLIGDFLIVISLNVAIWTTIMFVIDQFENNILAYLSIRVVLNMLVFPLLYIYLTMRYRGEKEFSIDTIHIRNEDF